MEEETRLLLRECNVGCKFATNSLEQVMDYVKEESLKELLDKYNKTHIKIGEECHALLNEMGEEEREPSVMANAFSHLTTQLKLMVQDDSKKIAELMMDGCNMGIKGISAAINKYPQASKESIALAKKIVKEEEKFMDAIKDFL